MKLSYLLQNGLFHRAVGPVISHDNLRDMYVKEFQRRKLKLKYKSYKCNCQIFNKTHSQKSTEVRSKNKNAKNPCLIYKPN